MLGVSRCKMRHLQTILAGSTVCFSHNHRQPRTEIFNSRRRSNEGIKRGAIWDFMTGKSPWGNPQIPILLLNGQGEKTPFVESLPPCFSTEHHLFPYVFPTYQNFGYIYRAEPKKAVSYITTKQPRLRFRMGLNQRPHD